MRDGVYLDVGDRFVIERLQRLEYVALFKSSQTRNHVGHSSLLQILSG